MKNIVMFGDFPAKEEKLGPGPWQDEPDKLQWTDEETGLPCLAVRSVMGMWCGYVGIPRSHPHYGKKYDDVDVVDVDVHGGLTFSDRCHEGGRICHKVEPGEDDDVWWLGFDCGHGMDIIPTLLQQEKERWSKKPNWPGSIYEHEDCKYRDLAYVKSEVTNLAKQLGEMGNV